MHEYLHVLVEAFIHTAKILPFLFIVYYLIELFEYKNAKQIRSSKLLNGKASPVFGAVLGCVPQCGFSVVSTDLFSKKKLSIGALIAVFIATSDEAIPLMISNPSSIGWMLLLVAIKIVFGITLGYLSIWLYSLIFKKRKIEIKNEHSDEHKDFEHEHREEDHQHEKEKEIHNENEEQGETIHGGCCHHHVETKTFDWFHPMLHCLKISLFILLINVFFECLTHIWVGEDKLIAFLSKSKSYQPLLAVVIGMIPNCASSVVITQLFVLGGLSFGALVAGLCVNAGLGLIVLLKQNKNWKENLFIILMTVIPSLILGYLLNFI